TGAGLITVLVAPEHQRADGDGVVHVPARAEVADRAAVEAAAHRLELVDDLHGAHLGGTHQRAGGGGGAEQVKRVATAGELAAHAAHHVHDVAVALDRAIGLDAHAAGVRHAPEVV